MTSPPPDAPPPTPAMSPTTVFEHDLDHDDKNNGGAPALTPPVLTPAQQLQLRHAQAQAKEREEEIYRMKHGKDEISPPSRRGVGLTLYLRRTTSINTSDDGRNVDLASNISQRGSPVIDSMKTLDGEGSDPHKVPTFTENDEERTHTGDFLDAPLSPIRIAAVSPTLVATESTTSENDKDAYNFDETTATGSSSPTIDAAFEDVDYGFQDMDDEDLYSEDIYPTLYPTQPQVEVGVGAQAPGGASVAEPSILVTPNPVVDQVNPIDPINTPIDPLTNEQINRDPLHNARAYLATAASIPNPDPLDPCASQNDVVLQALLSQLPAAYLVPLLMGEFKLRRTISEVMEVALAAGRQNDQHLAFVLETLGEGGGFGFSRFRAGAGDADGGAARDAGYAAGWAAGYAAAVGVGRNGNDVASGDDSGIGDTAEAGDDLDHETEADEESILDDTTTQVDDDDDHNAGVKLDTEYGSEHEAGVTHDHEQGLTEKDKDKAQATDGAAEASTPAPAPAATPTSVTREALREAIKAKIARMEEEQQQKYKVKIAGAGKSATVDQQTTKDEDKAKDKEQAQFKQEDRDGEKKKAE